MKIATWNINGIKARHDNLISWLEQSSPDIACLQEIKSADENFPREAIEALGYNLETHGQKSFNGVAILSKLPIDEAQRGLPLISNKDEPDEQARFIQATVSIEGRALHVISLYLPNGNPVDSDKFPYKLSWMGRLEAWIKAKLMQEEAFVLAGDYNVIPMPEDCHDPAVWEGDALFCDESRTAFRRLLNLGLVEAVRTTTDADQTYTFWDYQAGAWQKNNGIRIDHHLLSPEAAKLLKSVSVEKGVRAWEKPSDHVPVVIELAA